MGILLLKAIVIAVSARLSLCSIPGISYRDPLNFRRTTEEPGSNPCNPLYWYPKHIPDYCYSTTPGPLPRPPVPIPIPVPVPVPVGLPLPIPLPAPVPLSAPVPMPPLIPPLMSPFPPPIPPMPPAPAPFGVPIVPSNPLLPLAGVPYPPPTNPYQPYSYGQPAGMVPGLPGIVSQDGGINILPFSDAYSDVLEKHKNKLIRKRLRKVLEDYEDFPKRKWFRRHRKWRH